MATITDQLRKTVEKCGQTRAEISRETGIPESVLSRFVVGGHGLRSENMDKLAKYLGLSLIAKRAKHRIG